MQFIVSAGRPFAAGRSTSATAGAGAALAAIFFSDDVASAPTRNELDARLNPGSASVHASFDAVHPTKYTLPASTAAVNNTRAAPNSKSYA